MAPFHGHMLFFVYLAVLLLQLSLFYVLSFYIICFAEKQKKKNVVSVDCSEAEV